MQILKGGRNPERVLLEIPDGKLALQPSIVDAEIQFYTLGLYHELDLTAQEFGAVLKYLLDKSRRQPIGIEICQTKPHASKLFCDFLFREVRYDLSKGLHAEKHRRHNIRDAQSKGVKVDFLAKDDVQECVEISKLASARLGFPLFNTDIISASLQSEIAKVFAIRQDNALLGFDIVFLDRELSKVLPGIVAWKDEALESNAPSLVTYEIMKWSQEQGFRYFVSGRKEDMLTDKEANVWRFKESFGNGETTQSMPIYTSKTIAAMGRSWPSAYRLYYSYGLFKARKRKANDEVKLE